MSSQTTIPQFHDFLTSYSRTSAIIFITQTPQFQDFLTSLNRSAKEIGNLRADFRRLADNANTMLKRSTAQACVAPEAALVLENVMRWADSTAAEGRRADSTAAEGRRADEAAEEDDEDDEDEEQGARERGRGGHAVQGSEAETAVGHAQEQSDTPLLSSVVAAPGSYCFGGEFTDHSLAEDAERSEEIPSVLCRGLRGGSAVAEPPLAFAEDLRTSTSSRVTKSVSGFL